MSLSIHHGASGLWRAYIVSVGHLLFPLQILFAAALVAFFLRARGSYRDASDVFQAIRKQVTAGPRRKPQHRERQAKKDTPIALAAEVHTKPSLVLLLPHEMELLDAVSRLSALKFSLPEDTWLGDAHVAELHSIVNIVERVSGANLSRFRMAAPARRSHFRVNVMALLSFCNYRFSRQHIQQTFPHFTGMISYRVH